ncbi:Helix-turn-helix [Streptomyces sp. 3213]|uniref:helix-turn-helix domain-containing protein n=1 Tax=Streptomyces sp. 3213.3 TaxID=1855348 RepID=UPI000898D18E|nr:helix-turn-helix domain-containing protein [Streptomyces sp. 3213.3]SED63814.1 Helix-turn-helix [Streptomyces sp. 3213] [Streptomyces sp. 3213.3]
MEHTPQTLRQVLGAGLREIRKARGLKQEEAAALLQRHGLTTWIRGTVAQAEVGARRIALEEVLLLALAFEVPPADFVAGAPDDLVELSPGVRLTVAAVKALLSGNTAAVQAIPAQAVEITESLALTNRTSDFLAEVQRSGRVDPALVERAVASVGEAERHVARKIGTSPEWVNLVALRRWDRTLSQERDLRLQERRPEASKGQLATLRGHITRELLTELEHDLRGVHPDDARTAR